MKMIASVFLLCILSFNLYADSDAVGKVTVLKGKVFRLEPTTGIKRKKIMLKEGMEIYESDIIATEKNAYVEFEMVDSTHLSLAPSSSFEIRTFRYVPGKERVTYYHQSWGALRAKFRKTTRPNESIKFNTKNINVGIQDSEFLSNTYSVNNEPTNDLLLLKGKANIKVEKLNSKLKSFELREGLVFNSNLLKSKGANSFPKISHHFLDLLAKTKRLFLPRAQTAQGEFVNLNTLLEDKVAKAEKSFLEKNIIRRVSSELYSDEQYFNFLANE